MMVAMVYGIERSRCAALKKARSAAAQASDTNALLGVMSSGPA